MRYVSRNASLVASLTLLFLVWSLPIPAQASNKILVIGDSLSAAYGMPATQGWVHLLQQRLDQQHPGWQVINASITGDTSRGGLSRLPDALDQHQPAIVIIELGGNDGLRGFNLHNTRDNLLQMIRLAHAKQARVLLLGIKLPANYGKTYGQRFHAIYTDLARSEQISLLDFLLEGVALKSSLMQADGIHPNAQAQPYLLDNVWSQLQPLLHH